jgi:hypothetical protein
MREVLDLDAEVLKSLLVSTCEEVVDSRVSSVAVVGNYAMCEALRRGLEPLGLAPVIGCTIATDVVGWQRGLQALRCKAVETMTSR